ncbi:protein FAM83A [Salvelinus alpinus]|uniref:protein FAM83A n=1 Tax=Salvelinus alpinus TaxID=8036 RepID=UPI0039FD28AD
MNLQSNGLSVQWYLKSKPVGKVRRRVQEMKNPSVSLVSGDVDLSHNESTRLAMDALLNQGLDMYQEVLAGEGEVDFLSKEEKGYILENTTDLSTSSLCGTENEDQAEGSTTSSQTNTCCPSVSESEPPGLDHGWPAEDWSYRLQGEPSVEVYFQSDRAASMKDLLREFISKATMVLAIVMDTFSDVEMFCDILEATRKRNVSVYLLLDHINLQVFVKMCETLQINSNHLTKMSVRSIQGETYCAKSGRKLTGQIKEKFMIIDCTLVLAGSYSFTWLSWQVHRSLAVLFKGSAVEPFDLEFRKLYASSKPVPGFLTTATEFNLTRPLITHQAAATSTPLTNLPCPSPGTTTQNRYFNNQAMVQPTTTVVPRFNTESTVQPTTTAQLRYSSQNTTVQPTTTTQQRHPNTEPTAPPTSQQRHPNTQPTTSQQRHPNTQPTTPPTFQQRHPNTQPTAPPTSQQRHPNTQPTAPPTSQQRHPNTEPTTSQQRHPNTEPTTSQQRHPNTQPTTPPTSQQRHPNTQPTAPPTSQQRHPNTQPTAPPTSQQRHPNTPPTAPTTSQQRHPNTPPTAPPTSQQRHPNTPPTAPPTSQQRHPNTQPIEPPTSQQRHPNTQPTTSQQRHPNTQPTTSQQRHPNTPPTAPPTSQQRHPNTPPTAPPTSQCLVNQSYYTGPRSHRFDWITQRHTATRHVMFQRTFSTDYSTGDHLTWRPFNSNYLLYGGTTGLLDRHPLLKTGQWFTVPK